MMVTVFERIPDLFVQHYMGSFETWAREFTKRGRRCAIPFDREPGSAPPVLGPDGLPAVFAGAWFEAEVDLRHLHGPRVVIRPVDGEAEAAIERHTREMAPHWVS